MILFKNNEFKNAFIIHVVVICNHTYLFIATTFSIIFYHFLSFFIIFYHFLSITCVYSMILIAATICFFYYLKLMLIYLNLKISDM